MDNTLRHVRTNIVQSIRAHTVKDLQAAAEQLGHRFLYADLAAALTKQDVIDLVGQHPSLPAQATKNFDALHDKLTDALHKSGPQAGFIVVLEHIPTGPKFDKEAREQLLDAGFGVIKKLAPADAEHVCRCIWCLRWLRQACSHACCHRLLPH